MVCAFRRINPQMFSLVDDELVVLAYGSTTYCFPILVGTAFRTRDGRWRLLRLGAVDIGHADTPQMAILQLLADHRRHDDLVGLGDDGVVMQQTPDGESVQ